MEELRQQKNRLKRDIKAKTTLSKMIIEDNATKTEILANLNVSLYIFRTSHL